MAHKQDDIYSKVTNEIISALETVEDADWQLPWRRSGRFSRLPVNAVSGKEYRGVNTLLLWLISAQRGYNNHTWATYKQWKQLGAQVRKGERSAGIVYWNTFDAKSKPPQQDEELRQEVEEKRLIIARDYAVFNAAQVDGYIEPPIEKVTRTERIKRADEFFECMGAKPILGGDSAYYDPLNDSIHMPNFELFKEPLMFYSVLAHEATHWTAAEHRANRNLSTRYGSHAYAMEELIAELGAAFCCATLRLPGNGRRSHAAYIKSWLELLKNDKRAIFTAAGKAQQAVDWMLSQQHSEEPRVMAV